jgi:2-hydroxy-3-keto-5-methylthiopentenyl-1-phosphate phosphatase
MCHKTMSLDEALNSLDIASNHVTEKVSSSGVLRGLCVPPERIFQIIEDDEEVGDHVRLHPGCVEVITQATNKKWRLGVLSINWCPSLIDAALVRELVRHNNNQNSAAEFETPIWSNSVDGEGNVSLRVPGALAKKDRISELKSSIGDESTVMYVGDSLTDLAALVEADIVILIGQSKSTIAIAELWGVKVIPLKQRHKMTEDGDTMLLL